MARWHIESDSAAYDRSERICRAADLKLFGVMPRGHGAAYAKRAVPVPNVTSEGDAWLCVAGTFIYGGKLGLAALQMALRDFIADGIQAVRSRALGHYAVGILHDDILTVFTDPEGAHHCYYFVGVDGKWNISTSLQVCAAAAGSPAVDPMALWLTVCQTAMPGSPTLFPAIRRLFGTEALRIRVPTHDLRVERIGTAASVGVASFQSIDAAVKDYTLRVQEVFRQLASVGSIGLLGTGGMDSRTVLAALLNQGSKPTLLYGIGSGTSLTDDHPKDFAATREIAAAFDLRQVRLEWGGDYPHSVETLRQLFMRYGFQYEIYGAPQQMLRNFEMGVAPGVVLLLGGYSPAFIHGKPWEIQDGPFDLEKVLNFGLAYEAQTPSFRHQRAYREAYRAEVQDALQRTGVELDGKRESFVRAVLLLQVRASARFLNFANEFVPYVAPFFMRQLMAPILAVPLAYRAAAEFQVRLIYALEPRLLELPIYSGNTPCRVDKKTFHLQQLVEKKSVLGRLADIALPKKLREPTRRLYYYVRHGFHTESGKVPGRDESIRRAYGTAVMSVPLVQAWLTSPDNLRVKTLARLHQYLEALDFINQVL